MATPKIRPHQVGDICISVNSRYPEINNGLTVVIIGTDPGFKDSNGKMHPCAIRRIDGQVLGVTNCPRTNRMNWGKLPQAHCSAERLQRLPDPPDEVDQQVALMLDVDAALVKMLEGTEDGVGGCCEEGGNKVVVTGARQAVREGGRHCTWIADSKYGRDALIGHSSRRFSPSAVAISNVGPECIHVATISPGGVP